MSSLRADFLCGTSLQQPLLRDIVPEFRHRHRHLSSRLSDEPSLHSERHVRFLGRAAACSFDRRHCEGRRDHGMHFHSLLKQISYVDVAKPSYLRNSILKAGYGFRCTCPLCKDHSRDCRLLSYRCSCGGEQLPVLKNAYERPGRCICNIVIGRIVEMRSLRSRRVLCQRISDHRRGGMLFPSYLAPVGV